jgi:hypothetical protein
MNTYSDVVTNKVAKAQAKAKLAVNSTQTARVPS